MVQSMGLQRVGNDLATEQQQVEHLLSCTHAHLTLRITLWDRYCNYVILMKKPKHHEVEQLTQCHGLLNLSASLDKIPQFVSTIYFNKYSLLRSFTSNKPVSLCPYTILFTMILNLS